MRLYAFLFSIILLVATANGQSRFTRFELPLQVSVEVPQNWWLLSGDYNTTIEAAGEAATKLAGYNIPAGKKVNLLRANSMPRTTYASIAVNATDSDITPEDIRRASASELKELEQLMADGMKQVLAAGNLRFLESLGLERRVVSEHVALVFSYRRSGSSGPVVVSMTRLFVGSKEISFNLSYREAEGAIWKPVIEYMRKSIKVRKSG